MPREFSYSQIYCFKRCRFSWDLQYQKRVYPKKKDSKLLLGEGVHVGLADYYDPNTPRTKAVLLGSFSNWYAQKFKTMLAEHPNMFEEERTNLNNLKILGTGMLSGYEEFAKANDDFEVIITEGYYKVPIYKENGQKFKGHFFIFKLDGIVKDSYGKYWILEHKTSASFPDKDEFLIMDEQISYYIWAAQLRFGFPIEGVIYNVLVKETPSIPAVLANGKTSKAKIATNYETYLATLKERSENLSDYEEILNYYKIQNERFYFRTKVYRNPEEIKNTGIDLYYIIQDMCHRPKIYRSTARECTFSCGYKLICMTLMDGSDIEFVLKNNYETIN